MKCPRCKRDAADEADLAIAQLTAALTDSMEIIEVLLGDAPKRLPHTTEQVRGVMTLWSELLTEAKSKTEWK